VNVWIVHNPAAGAYDIGPSMGRVAQALAALGLEVRQLEARQPGELGILARRAVQAGCDALLVAGGDGSLNEAATALSGSGVALGVLPAGTANVWAKQFGLPVAPLLPGFDPGDMLLQAARAQLDGQRRLIDVGEVRERCFLLWAGVGLDAFVTHGVEPRPREQKRLGMLSYSLAALILATQFTGMRARIIVDGRRIKGRMLLAVVSNGQLYLGGLARIAPQARLDDGLLDVWLFYGLGFHWTVRQMLGLVAGRHLRDPYVKHFRGRTVSILTAVPAALQLDGEPAGTTPVTVRIRSAALTVLVPRTAPANLFSSSAG
jgi:YegS/Rv2252/BmrU family lipid kinase